MTKATFTEAPVDQTMVTMVAMAHYQEYIDLVKPEDVIGWYDLTQDERDHYIRSALKTFGIPVKEPSNES